MLMSLSYAMLNLPHFITWMIFFYNVAFKPKIETSAIESSIESSTSNNIFFAANYISEIFYVLNYGIHFFIYCASDKRFRTQLMSALRCNYLKVYLFVIQIYYLLILILKIKGLFIKTKVVQRRQTASFKANKNLNQHHRILKPRKYYPTPGVNQTVI